MTKRVKHYLGTLKVVNGEIAPEDQHTLKMLKQGVAILNQIQSAEVDEYGRLGRYRVLRRYRGPRAKTRRNRQSMCLRSEATSVDLYAYRERKWS